MDTLQSLLTPVIAAIAVLIAYEQWRTNALKVRIDLFDRRMEVYEAATVLIWKAITAAKLDSAELNEFRAGTAKAAFLFDQEVTDYLKTVDDQGVELAIACSEYRDSTQEQPEGYDHQDVVRRKHTALKWLMNQPKPMKDLFRKHMHLIS